MPFLFIFLIIAGLSVLLDLPRRRQELRYDIQAPRLQTGEMLSGAEINLAIRQRLNGVEAKPTSLDEEIRRRGEALRRRQLAGKGSK